MLVRCLYASRPVKPITNAMLDEILEHSRRSNVERGITGLLCFTSNLFIQVLEGGRDPVCELFSAIVRDERHTHVRLLAFDEIAERRFGGWTMGRVNISTINSSLLLKYSERAEIDPFAASGAATMTLLLELVATGAIASRPG